MKTLRAGPLSLVFEETYGSVRRLSVAGHEIVRRVYAAVRDKDWNTVPFRVWNVKLQEAEDSFSISYIARAEAGPVDFAWNVSITGDPRGSVKFRMAGQARNPFAANRIGLCVLHPARTCAGLPCSVESADGGLRRGSFPRYVYPHPPFTNFRKVWYAPAPGLGVRVDFEGEIFEMEDQRNWTDASFKSYSNPPHATRPIPWKRGDAAEQTVTVSLEDAVPEPRPAPPARITIDAKPTHPLPPIGLQIASRPVALGRADVERLRALRPAHLRADVKLPEGLDLLPRAFAEAKDVGAALELALHLSEGFKIEQLRDALKNPPAPVARVLLFQDGLPVVSPARAREAKAVLGPLLPGTPIGGGSDGHFETLNVEQAGREWDVVAWPVSPQVHHHDDWTFFENLEGLSATVESARLFSGERPLCVSPITFQPRFGPGAPGEMGSAPDVDDRQWALAGAAWTVGSLKRLGEAGASSLTYFETIGARGVMDRGSRAVYPLYHVLADALEFAGGRVVPCRSGDPLAFEAAAFSLGGKIRVLAANLSEEPRTLAVEPLPSRVALKRLNAETLKLATSKPRAWRAAPPDVVDVPDKRLDLSLGPWEVVRIDA